MLKIAIKILKLPSDELAKKVMHYNIQKYFPVTPKFYFDIILKNLTLYQ